MSLFGTPDDTDRRERQRRDLAGLTELVQLGIKRKLPPLNWRLPNGYATVAGTVDHILGEQHPREAFEAWFEALSKHPRMAPRPLGLRSDGVHRDERITPDETRMIAAFTLRLTEHSYPSCDIAIVAEWFADDIKAKADDL